MNNSNSGVRYALLAAIFAVLLSMTSVMTFDAIPALAADTDEETKTAEVVVQFGDSDAIVRSVEFTGTISSLELLDLAGISYVTKEYGWGKAVCSIEGVGCLDDCFCKDGRWWGSNYWQDDAWVGYLAAANTTEITQTGSADGWRFGTGDQPIALPQAQSAEDALSWLAERQSAVDGSDGSFASATDAMLAIGANHIPAADWKRDQWAPSLMDYVAKVGPVYAGQGAAQAGKLAISTVSAQGCWPPDAKKPSDYFSPSLDAMGAVSGELSWAIMGTVALSETLPGNSVTKLKSLADPEGGWGISAAFNRDTNTTSLAIQALIAAGESVTSTEVMSGWAFLKTAQNDDGGFTYDPASTVTTDSDTNSTAYAIQAILAAGQDPASGAWTKNGANGFDFLASVQLDDGSFGWLPGSVASSMATQQAVPALLVTPMVTMPRQLEECTLDYRWTYYLPDTIESGVSD